MIFLDFMTPQTIDWIEAHKDDDTSALRLKYHGMSEDVSGIDYTYAILQVECRRKAAKKLASTLRYRAFEFPTALSAEQSTSDRLAAFHASMIPQGASVVDLTSGLGIDVFHFAGLASHVTAVEIDPVVAGALINNAAVLGLDNINVVNADCRDFLADLPHYDVAFIDPARRGDGGRRLYALEECRPNIIEMIPSLSRCCGTLVVKMSPMLDVTAVCRQLSPYIVKLIAIGDRHECKELVAVLDFNANMQFEDVSLQAVTLMHDDGLHRLVFTDLERRSAEPDYAEPSVGDMIIEPYPSVMKMAPWNVVCDRYGLSALHPNSHLYIGKDDCSEIGVNYTVKDVIPYSSSEIKRLAGRYPRLSVATRNFPLNADALRKKLHVADADAPRLYATTLLDGLKVMIIAS